MRPPMTADDFAAMVDMPADDIRSWAAAGLLDPRGRGQFDEFDLLRLMTIRHYDALGYDPTSFKAGLESGEIEPFLGEYIYPRGQELTIEEAAGRLDVEADMLQSLRTALGFTRETFIEEDIQGFEMFKAMLAAGMPFEAVLEGARVFGDSLRRLAETETRLVHVHIHERLEAEGVDEEGIIRQVEDLQEAALPLLDGMVEFIHHEHLLLAAIEDAYVHLVDTDAPGGFGSVDATIAFVDVESFTQLTASRGDEAAMDTMTRVDSTIRGIALEHSGKVVKQIGDALMLAFRDSEDAVRFGVQLEETIRADPSLPGLRTGMHCGPAIYRGGDYLGATVNVASRVSSQATAGETLVTDVVAERVDDGVLEPAGVRMLRGVEKPLSLYRLRHLDKKVDPVCGEQVESPPAARLQQDGDELWFCSKDCLRSYLGSEVASA
jgi:adenylate cyclase